MKKNTKLKYLPIAAFAAVAVALAGCGGGGSSPVTSAPADTPTIAVADLGADGTIEAGTYQLTGTPEELLALAAAIAGIDEPPEGGYAPGETVTIPGFADLTCTGDVNCTVMVADDGTVTTTGTIMTAALGEGPGTEPMPTTQVALTAAEEALAAAKEAVTALEADEDATPAQIATAEAAVLTAEEARDTAQTAHDDYVATTPEAIAAAAVEAKERAEGLATAIDGAKADATGAFDSSVTAVISATHDGDAATIAVPTVSGGTGTGVFVKQEEGPPSIKGWAGARFTRGEATEHVTVYTNIGAPKPTLYSDVDGYDDLTGGVVTDVTIDAYVGLAASDSFPDAPATKGSSSTQTYAEGSDRTFAGTFHGGEGNYECTSDSEATCSVTTSDKGALTFVGTWTFTFAAKAMVNVVDSDYLHFGWWVDAPAMSDGTYAFQTFAGANAVAFADGQINEVEGTATYKGAAAGMYVTKDVTAGLVTGATAGGFTASATLQANFGDDTAAGNIDGSIHDFMNAEGEAMAGWGVTLRNSILAAGSSTFSGDTMGTTGPGTTGPGNWTGTFYGPSEAVDTVRPQPTGVAGRFDAHLPGAHIAGAYGASR